MSFFSAPSIILTEKYPSTVIVEIEQPEEDPAIQLYRVTLENGNPNQTCTILAYSSPLTCEINDLTPGASHTVEVKACIRGDDVYSTRKETFAVKPPGELSFSLIA